MYDIVLDLETTGVRIHEDLPIQIGFLVAQEEKILKEESFYLHEFSVPIHPSAEKAHGITKDILHAKGREPAKAAKYFMDLVWKHQPARLIGYNIINFDYPMFTHWMHKYILGRFKLPPFCAIEDIMFLGGCLLGSKKWLKLQVMAEKFNLDTSTVNWHDALADVQVTYRLWTIIKSQMHII